MNGLALLTSRPWIWSFIATVAVWIITILFTGGAGAHGLSHAAFTFASFSVIVGLGQMFVITLGPGNIDLSVPANMTLAATLALKLMDSQEGMILAGLAVALLIGLAVGICNYALIKLLRIPPIIATLSMSFLIQSTAIWSNRGLRVKPPESLAQFTTASTFGIPNVAIVALILSVIGWVLLKRASTGAGFLQSARTRSRRAWPGSPPSMARASSPICSAPFWPRSAASCLPVSRAARR
ncbi:hypothetical protein Q644_18930 [Brucella intermedia 229E]|uniref:ABC transporter permease n=1 Tax=Brucella intermedia 229E TaxID=1337887 RepID=U4VGH7_9HYPH|nr:hypothetical protein Q644_18930 [Brucella intermedia 229E]